MTAMTPMAALLIFVSGLIVGVILAMMWMAKPTIANAIQQAEKIKDEARLETRRLLVAAKRALALAEDLRDKRVREVEAIEKLLHETEAVIRNATERAMQKGQAE